MNSVRLTTVSLYKKLRYIWPVIIIFFSLCVNAEDEIVRIANAALRQNPELATVQTNAGHFTNLTAISCDGKYLFGSNTSELSIRERNSLRVIKSFPLRGIRAIIPDMTDSDVVILKLDPFIYNWKTSLGIPALIINWKTGSVLGHLKSSDILQAIDAHSENFIWDDTYGFVAGRNVSSYSGNGYIFNGQGTVDINKNDSLLVISSMYPLVWDMRHGKIVGYIPLADWLIENDTTLNQENIRLMMPKPKKWRKKNNSAIRNRNIFSAKFTDANTVKVGGPSPYLTEWDVEGTLKSGVRLPLEEGVIFDFSCFEGNIVAATSDGFFRIDEESKSTRLDQLCNERSNLPAKITGVANIVSRPFGAGLFVSSLCKSDSVPMIRVGNFRDGGVEKSISDNSWGEILDIKISKDEKMALATNAYSIAELNLKEKNAVPLKKIEVPTTYDGSDFLESVEILPNGRYLVGTAFGDVKVYDPNAKEWGSMKKMHRYPVRSMALSHDGTKLITTDSGNTTVIWDASTLEPTVSVANFWPFGVLTFTPDGYYSYEAVVESLGSLAHISKDNRTYSFDQFDLTLNRPDIIAERLGASKEYVDKLNKAWKKRVRRNGFDPEKLASGYHTPEVEILNKKGVPSTTGEKTTNLQVKLSDSLRNIERAEVMINGVPIKLDPRAVAMSEETGAFQILNLEIPLKVGINAISVQTLNDQGAKSLTDEISIVRQTDAAVPRTLWMVSIGVSEYEDPAYALSYASKDAKDFSETIKGTVNTFDHIKTLTLTDKEFSQESTNRISNFLEWVSVDDAVVFFYAGHGVLDSNLDYYLAPANMDFSSPSSKGVPVGDLIEILENVKALDRYIIIDACHSGQVDKEDYIMATEIRPEELSAIRFRNFGSLRERSKEAIEISSLASDIFEDLNISGGATYISSAAGNEVAVESDLWENGLFTKAFKDALRRDEITGLPVCLDGRSELTIEDVFEYARENVRRISQNSQNPRKTSGLKSEKLIIFNK